MGAVAAAHSSRMEPGFVSSFSGTQLLHNKASFRSVSKTNARVPRWARKSRIVRMEKAIEGDPGGGAEVTVPLVKNKLDNEPSQSSSSGKGATSGAEKTVPLVKNKDEDENPQGVLKGKETVEFDMTGKEQVTEEDLEDPRTEKEKEIDRLRAAEKFITVDEGDYECKGCGYVYEKRKGEFLSGIPKGTAFEDLPKDFRCPSCKSSTSNFEKKVKVIAGFAENQQYGLGSNTLTPGQKSALIYGSLLIFFFLFLGGYFLN